MIEVRHQQYLLQVPLHEFNFLTVICVYVLYCHICENAGNVSLLSLCILQGMSEILCCTLDSDSSGLLEWGREFEERTRVVPSGFQPQGNILGRILAKRVLIL